jgi:hypothetical protein
MQDGGDRFRPLRPASHARVVAAIVFGPLTWIAAFVITSWVVEYTDAIALGLLIAALSCLFAVIVLSVLRWGRHREERRYADRR